jgi:hypothetical protein
VALTSCADLYQKRGRGAPLVTEEGRHTLSNCSQNEDLSCGEGHDHDRAPQIFPSAGSDVKSEMHRYKQGTAKSGPGGRGGAVKSRKQAIAIGLSKARKKGKKVPAKNK